MFLCVCGRRGSRRYGCLPQLLPFHLPSNQEISKKDDQDHHVGQVHHHTVTVVRLLSDEQVVDCLPQIEGKLQQLQVRYAELVLLKEFADGGGVREDHVQQVVQVHHHVNSRVLEDAEVRVTSRGDIEGQRPHQQNATVVEDV